MPKEAEANWMPFHYLTWYWQYVIAWNAIQWVIFELKKYTCHAFSAGLELDIMWWRNSMRFDRYFLWLYMQCRNDVQRTFLVSLKENYIPIWKVNFGIESVKISNHIIICISLHTSLKRRAIIVKYMYGSNKCMC